MGIEKIRPRFRKVIGIGIVLWTVIFSQPADLPAAGQITARDPTWEPRTFEQNPFGLAYRGIYSGKYFLDQARDLQAGCVHINIRWPEIQKPSGQTDWSSVDNFINQLAPGECALLRIKSGSRRVSKNGITLPDDLDQYKRFVTDVVKRTQGKVRFFENDWEVDNRKFWNDTPANYLKLLRAFSQSVRAANPEALVVVGGHSGHFTPDHKPSQAEFN